MRGREEVELSIPGHMVDIPVETKSSRVDDAKENSKYTNCLH